MKAWSNSYKLKAFIVPKITYIVKFFDNNGISAVYTRVIIHGIYCYLEIIGDPTTLTTSVQRSHNSGLSTSTNNDRETPQPVIAALCVFHKTICKFCDGVGDKAGFFIIRGPKLLPPSIRRNMNQFNALHNDKPNEPPREWNSQPPAVDFKYRTYPPKTSLLVSYIIRKLNHHGIDNDGVEVHPS